MSDPIKMAKFVLENCPDASIGGVRFSSVCKAYLESVDRIKELEAQVTVAREALDMLISDTCDCHEAIEAFKDMNSEENKTQTYRAWCSGCSSYIRGLPTTHMLARAALERLNDRK